MSAADINYADEMVVLGQVVRAVVLLGGALLAVDAREDGRRAQFRFPASHGVVRLTVLLPGRSATHATMAPASPFTLRVVAESDGTPAHMLAWARTGGTTGQPAMGPDGVRVERSALGWRASLDVPVDTLALAQESQSGLLRGRVQRVLTILAAALSNAIG